MQFIIVSQLTYVVYLKQIVEHVDGISRKSFICYVLFVWGILQWSVVYPQKGCVMQNFGGSFVASLNKLLKK